MVALPFQSLIGKESCFGEHRAHGCPFLFVKTSYMLHPPKTESPFGIYSQELKDKWYLLTPSESIFFQRLSDYLADSEYHICPKVRVWDIIYIEKKRWHRLWNFIGRPYEVSGKLDRSHIDFALIDKKTSLIKYAIELDDLSHDSPQAKYHDKVKNEAFKTVKIPILRFKEAHVTKKELEEKIIL